jgi:hypothetical protein
LNPSKLLASDIEGILQQFYYGVPHALKKHREHCSSFVKPATLANMMAYDEESIVCINRIKATIENHKSELLRNAAVGIFAYLTSHKIKSQSGDQFKLAYWFGMALVSKLQDELDRRVALILTTCILNIFCDAHCDQKMPVDLCAKMFMSIANGTSADDFGQLGLYFPFKVISKLK